MKTEKTNYVVGFMFDASLQCVALIRKNKPDWQKGRLNGIGGKVEPFDGSSIDAMTREFKEEAGVVSVWNHYARMFGPGWSVECFASVGDLNELRSLTDEKVEIVYIKDLPELKTIGNIPWLVAMALDSMKKTGPAFAEVLYAA